MSDLDYRELFRDAIQTMAEFARAAGFDSNDPTVEPPAIVARVENLRAEVERLTAERAALLAPVEGIEGIVDVNEVPRLSNAYRALAGIPPAERTTGERADLVNVAESLALDAPTLAREVIRLRGAARPSTPPASPE